LYTWSASGAEPSGVGGNWIFDIAYCWVSNFFWRSFSSASRWDNVIAYWRASSSSSSAWIFPVGLVVVVVVVVADVGGCILPVLQIKESFFLIRNSIKKLTLLNDHNMIHKLELHLRYQIQVEDLILMNLDWKSMMLRRDKLNYLQLEQNVSPHARQWCLRINAENDVWQRKQESRSVLEK